MDVFFNVSTLTIGQKLQRFSFAITYQTMFYILIILGQDVDQ